MASGRGHGRAIEDGWATSVELGGTHDLVALASQCTHIRAVSQRRRRPPYNASMERLEGERQDEDVPYGGRGEQ